MCLAYSSTMWASTQRTDTRSPRRCAGLVEGQVAAGRDGAGGRTRPARSANASASRRRRRRRSRRRGRRACSSSPATSSPASARRNQCRSTSAMCRTRPSSDIVEAARIAPQLLVVQARALHREGRPVVVEPAVEHRLLVRQLERRLGPVDRHRRSAASLVVGAYGRTHVVDLGLAAQQRREHLRLHRAPVVGAPPHVRSSPFAQLRRTASGVSAVTRSTLAAASAAARRRRGRGGERRSWRPRRASTATACRRDGRRPRPRSTPVASSSR